MHAPATSYAILLEADLPPRRHLRAVEERELRHYIVIVPNEAPMSLHEESWLVALGVALDRVGLGAAGAEIQVSRSDHRTWHVEEVETGRRYVIIDTAGERPTRR